MPKTWRYIGFDRIIETDHPIRGALADDGPGGDAERIRISRMPAVETWGDDPPLWSFDNAVLQFAPPGVGRYRCTRDAIAVEPLATASLELVDALLIATALPAVLWMQGAFVLHAAAIIPAARQGALAIAGRSGSGKSRLAAAFMERSARFVADDSIAIVANGGGLTCAGLAGGYHLGAPDEAERPFHVLPRDRTCRSAPLDAIVILDDVDAPVRLTAVESVGALLTHRHRASVLRQIGAELLSLRAAALFADLISVYKWPHNQADALLDDKTRGAIERARSSDDRYGVAAQRGLGRDRG